MKYLNLNALLNVLLIALVAVYVGRYFYMKPKFVNGAKPPSFSSQTITGAPFHLDQLKGKFVLLDFWGSWCGPCRKDHPDLIQIYQKYNRNHQSAKPGFEIVSIAIEQNPSAMKKAIQKDQLPWTIHILDQVSNFKFFDGHIATLYGIKQIPTRYLLNPDGVIVKVNPTLTSLETFLEERL